MTATSSTLRLALGIGVIAALAGCKDKPQSGGSHLDVEEDVRTWANGVSAVAVYMNVHNPIAFADGEHTFVDAACPATSDDGTTVSIEGGCTDSDGKDWVGTATIVRSGEDRTATFEGFGNDPQATGSLSGTFELREITALTHEFTADLVREGGLTTTIEYEGRVEGGYDTSTTWNGSGTMERDGMVTPVGVVTASTEDELLDETVCVGQAVSGSTTIDDGDEVAVITYDGGEDCDENDSARWSLDGEDQGLLTGIICSTSPGTSRSAPVAGLALLAVLVAVRTSRRR